MVQLAGCDIESYLLEKSRITQQQEVERSYHIFYQLLQPFVPDMKAKCMLDDDIYYYSYVSQGKVTVASIDDNEELEYTDSAFDVLGFTTEEKWDCFKTTAAVMTMGEMKFKQKGREEQCEPDAMDVAAKVTMIMMIMMIMMMMMKIDVASSAFIIFQTSLNFSCYRFPKMISDFEPFPSPGWSLLRY